jgi:hypothetical protein
MIIYIVVRMALILRSNVSVDVNGATYYGLYCACHHLNWLFEILVNVLNFKAYIKVIRSKVNGVKFEVSSGCYIME